MVATWFETWKSTVKLRAGAIALCVGLVVNKWKSAASINLCELRRLLLLALVLPSVEVHAQTWLPAPATRVTCSGAYTTAPGFARATPDPIIPGQSYQIEISVGNRLVEYYFEIVGSELRFHARVGSAMEPPSPGDWCYRFTDGPLLPSSAVSNFSLSRYVPFTNTIWSTSAATNRALLSVAQSNQNVPTIGVFALFALGMVVVRSAQKHLERRKKHK